MDVWEVPNSSCPGLDSGPLMDVGPEQARDLRLRAEVKWTEAGTIKLTCTGRTGELNTSKSLRAAGVRCSAWFGPIDHHVRPRRAIRQAARAPSRLSASGYRPSGSLARQRRTTASKSAGMSDRRADNGSGASYRCAANVFTLDRPANGACPVSRKYASAPRL